MTHNHLLHRRTEAAVRSVPRLFSTSTKRYSSTIGQSDGNTGVLGLKGADFQKLGLSRLPEGVHQSPASCASELLLIISIDDKVHQSQISNPASVLVLEDDFHRLKISVGGLRYFNKFVIMLPIPLLTRRIDEILVYVCTIVIHEQ